MWAVKYGPVIEGLLDLLDTEYLILVDSDRVSDLAEFLSWIEGLPIASLKLEAK